MNKFPRAYHFCNYYLSHIQHGIQTAHCQTQFFKKYGNIKFVTNNLKRAKNYLYEWLDNPTTICLNGGNNQELKNILEDLEKFESFYPMASFHEDDESLGGLLTNVGIIVPYKIWGAYDELMRDSNKKFFVNMYLLREDNKWVNERISEFEKNYGNISYEDARLIDSLRSFKLA